MAWGPRLPRALLAGVLALAVVWPLGAPRAQAATDVVERLEATFAVQADGTVEVTYVLDWNFGEAGRRGIEFAIATREPWENDDDLDAVYDVSDVEVQSPSGASDLFTQTSHEDGSYGEVRLRIGDPNEVLDVDRATYEISWTLDGALRTFDGVPELHQDVTSGAYPPIREFAVTVTGPEGVDDARCLAGSDDCDHVVDGDTATLTGSDVAAGDVITAVAALPRGSVDDAEPVLEPVRTNRSSSSARGTNGWEILGGWVLGAAGLVGAAVAGGRVGTLRLGRDKRYVDAPPGTVVRGGAVAESRRNPGVAVQFHPPKVDFATAGILLDGHFRARHTAAALTELAVHGAVEMESDPFSIAAGSDERVDGPLDKALFDIVHDRGVTTLTNRSTIRALNRAVHDEQTALQLDRRYFQNTNTATVTGRRFRWAERLRAVVIVAVGVVVAVGSLVAAFAVESRLLAGLLIGTAIGALWGIRRGFVQSRTTAPPLGATGTALRDQLRGFRTYLATAESRQLDFEADEDVYRRYLPWAVLFGMTRRWTKVCRRLAAAGRIPPLDASFAGHRGAPQLARDLTLFSWTASGVGGARATVSGSGPGWSDGGSGWSAGGGSGGSSGFSSGGGGSGGGGTSAGSW